MPKWYVRYISPAFTRGCVTENSFVEPVEKCDDGSMLLTNCYKNSIEEISIPCQRERGTFCTTYHNRQLPETHYRSHRIWSASCQDFQCALTGSGSHCVQHVSVCSQKRQ